MLTSDPSGNVGDVEYIDRPSGGQLLGSIADGGNFVFFNDWLGTKRVEVTQAGQVGQGYLNLPFGEGLNWANYGSSDISDKHFTGQPLDFETNLSYFGARYYAHYVTRFMSPDWSATVEPVPYAKLDDPQSLNLYAYVGNNPLSRIDGDGHIGGIVHAFDNLACQMGDTMKCDPVTQDAINAAPQQQNAGASPSSGGTSTTVTLNIGGKKVTVAYSYGKIFSNYGGGVDITATPQNCSGCAWAQVYSRGSGAKKDGDGIGPLYGDEGSGLSVFNDTPASSSSGRFTATTILGTTDISGKSFTAIGGFTYGYSINANGGVTMMAPRVATSQQMGGAIQVLQNNSPDWTIH